MKGRIALVTGGTGGIGTAISQQLSARGATVIASYNRRGNHASAQEWQQEQKQFGYDIDVMYADVCDYESCGELIANIKAKYGKIDILVNNAGITRDSQLYKMNCDQWHEVLKTNLDSIFNVTRHIITLMIEQGYGRIINISSINAQKGQFGQSNYSAAKAGIHGFTKSLAQEVARKGITVNTISPGYIETKMLATLNNDIKQKIIDQIPIGRLGKPEEVARAVSFLASDQSSFITGSNLVINGGQYLS